MKKHLPLLCLSFLAALLIIREAFSQGPLVPPGAPAPTQKTLQQIEPRVDLLAAIPGPGVSSDATSQIIISLPGSYYLSGNLTMTKTNGINVTAEGVTIDLGGFQIIAGSSGAKVGVVIQPAADNCVVENGTITGAGQSMTGGVACVYNSGASPTMAAGGSFRRLAASSTGNGFTGGTAWNYERCAATRGTGYGFQTPASGASTLTDCTATQNALGGFNFNGTATFLNCQSLNNGAIGFYIFGSGTFSNCNAAGNQQRGFQASNGSALSNCSATGNLTGGITFGSGSASNCAATSNTGIGFDVGFGVALSNCTSTANSSHGFLVQYSGSLTGCTAYNNGTNSFANAVGFYCGSGTLQNCTASNNTGNGISMSGNSSVIGCLAQSNGLSGSGAGINVGDGSFVKDCNTAYNQADGIIATQYCTIIANTALGNCIGGAAGVAGIRVTGGENRIEANNVLKNSISANTAIGISATLTGAPRNLLIRNTARNSDLNFVVAPGNRVAQIVVPATSVTQINGANGSGGSGTEGFTGLDPWANFTY